MTGRSAQEHARTGSPLLRVLRGMVRRFTVTATAGQLWKLVGVRGLEGDDETATVEVFQGIGFASRPPTSGKPEAIVVNVGGAKAPVIVAVRDEKTHAALREAAGEIAAGETMIYTAAAVVLLKTDGTVEIRTPAGTAVPLATKADVDAIRTALNGHTHTYLAGALNQTAPTLTTLNPSVPAPSGTTVLKGE